MTASVRHPIGNRQARRRLSSVFSNQVVARHAGAVFEPLENRAMLSSVWLNDGVLNIRGSDSPNVEVNVEYTARLGGGVQVHMSGSDIQSFLRSDVARIDIVGTNENNSIVLSTDEPVAADIHGLNGNDVIVGRTGKGSTPRSSGTDSASARGGNDVIYGGTPNDSLFGGWATVNSMPTPATIL